MRPHPRTAAATILTLTTAAILTGCTADPPAVEPGAASAVPVADTAALVPAAPGELDPGPYRTTAVDIHTPTVPNAESGQYVESERLAEFVVLPFEVDPELTVSSWRYTRTLASSAAIGHLLSRTTDAAEGKEVFTRIAAEHGAYAGFSTARGTSGYVGDRTIRQMVHAVLQFPDAGSATAAAAAMHHDHLTRTRTFLGTTSVAVDHPISGAPGSLVSATSGSTSIDVSAFTPHGRFVLYTWLDAPLAQQDWIGETIIDTTAQQRLLLDRFPATDPQQLGELKMDLDEVLRLTVPTGDDEDVPINTQAVFGPRGAAHLSTDPAGTVAAFEATGTTHLALFKTNLYRSRTEAGSQDLFDRLVAMMREQGPDTAVTAAAGPAGVPNSRCFEVVTTSSAYASCLVQNGTHVGEIFGEDLTDAHQQTTAQYLILLDHATESGS